MGHASTEGLGSTRPLDLDLAILGKAISEIEIDEALIRNPGFAGHAFEILNNVFRKPHGHRLLEL